MPIAIETYTKIKLISNALILCGEKPLNSLSDNRYGATVGDNLFSLIYESELQSNRWRFAMMKRALNRLTNVPLNEWQYAYQLPSDMLLPIGMYPKQPYEIYAAHLYTNAASVEMDYMFKPDISQLPAHFCLLLTYALAKNFIKPITESETAVRTMTQAYVMQRSKSLFADAQGRPNKAMLDSPFTDVR